MVILVSGSLWKVMILGRILIPSIGGKDVTWHTIKSIQASKLFGIISTTLSGEIISDTSWFQSTSILLSRVCILNIGSSIEKFVSATELMIETDKLTWWFLSISMLWLVNSLNACWIGKIKMRAKAHSSHGADGHLNVGIGSSSIEVECLRVRSGMNVGIKMSGLYLISIISNYCLLVIKGDSRLAWEDIWLIVLCLVWLWLLTHLPTICIFKQKKRIKLFY